MERKFVWIVAVLLISITHALPASIPVPGGLVRTVLVRCSFSLLPNSTGRINLKVTRYSSSESRLIYNSYREVPRPDLATFLGDLAKGDCSLMLPNNSRDSVIDFNLINVNQPNVTLSVVEDPQPHGGASGMTVAAAAETSPTAGPHFLGWKGIVAVVVGVVIVVAAAAVIFIPKHCRSSGSSPGSHSGDGQADVHGDVEKNGHLLMEVNGHKWDNGDKGTGTI